MTSTTQKATAACTLTGSEQVSRRDRWLRLAERALVAKTATEAGVELRYRPDPAVLSELTELAGLETECCGFAQWNVPEDGDAIRLDVETKPSQAPAVWALFDERPPAAGGS